MSWTADIIVKKRCVTKHDELDSKGNPRKIFFRVFSVVVTNGIDELLFSVRKDGWLGDSRQQMTGISGATGPWNTGKAVTSAGGRQSVHPNEWIRDMSRLIGYDRAVAVVEQLGFFRRS